MMGNWMQWHGFGMGFGWLPMILFWGLVIFALVAVLRWVRSNAALETLKQRYARGEIGREEYEQKKQDLAA